MSTQIGSFHSGVAQKAWKQGIKYYHVNDNKMVTHYGRKSRVETNMQLKNNYVDNTDSHENIAIFQTGGLLVATWELFFLPPSKTARI